KAGLFREEHQELRAAVRKFVEGQIRPRVEQWEAAGDFPYREVFRAAGSLGLFGAKYEEEFGGTGPDLVADAVITEELARCGSGGAQGSGAVLPVPVRRPGAATAMAGPGCGRRGDRGARRHRARCRIRRGRDPGQGRP